VGETVREFPRKNGLVKVPSERHTFHRRRDHACIQRFVEIATELQVCYVWGNISRKKPLVKPRIKSEVGGIYRNLFNLVIVIAIFV
jgi:hypothetical protein